jgi:hypothetical protein
MVQCSEVIYSTLNEEYASSQKTTTIFYLFTYLLNNPKANYKVSMNMETNKTPTNKSLNKATCITQTISIQLAQPHQP